MAQMIKVFLKRAKCMYCLQFWRLVLINVRRYLHLLIKKKKCCPNPKALCREGFWNTFYKPFDRGFQRFLREVIKKHARFRQMCNSFFVDLVSTMCFKDNSPPQKDVVNVLLSLLFVEKELFREASQSEWISS